MLHVCALALLCLLFNFNAHTIPPRPHIPNTNDRTSHLLHIKQKIVKHHHNILKDKRIRPRGNHGLSPMQLLHLARVYNHALLFQELELSCSQAIGSVLFEINCDQAPAFASQQEYEQIAHNIPDIQNFENQLLTSYASFARYAQKPYSFIDNFYFDLRSQINKITNSQIRSYLFAQIDKII